MTHRYNQMNAADALYIAARGYPGGVEALAARMGMSVKVLYNKLCPKTDSHHINFDEVSVILDFLADAGKHDSVEMVINAFNWRHDRVAVKLPEHEPDDEQLFSQVLRIMNSHGVLADGLHQALRDDDINARELEAFEQDFQTCILGLLQLRCSIHAKANNVK